MSEAPTEKWFTCGGHLLAVKLRSFYATSEKRKQFNNKFL